jgi:hypothetical protein
LKTTATQLVTFWTCPFLWHVSYQVKQPLPVWGTRRRFGTVIHAAIAEYERRGRSLERGFLLLEDQRAGLTPQDIEEARSILLWRHERAQGREGRPVLIEGSLRAYLDGHQLEVRMDRLDCLGGEYLLAEYKGGKSVDLELVRVQLLILSFAILDVFVRAPARWEVEMLRARKVLGLPADQDPGALRLFVAGLIRRMLDGDQQPRPYASSFCRRCPARRFCPRGTDHPEPLSRGTARKTDSQLLLF